MKFNIFSRIRKVTGEPTVVVELDPREQLEELFKSYNIQSSLKDKIAQHISDEMYHEVKDFLIKDETFMQQVLNEVRLTLTSRLINDNQSFRD